MSLNYEVKINVVGLLYNHQIPGTYGLVMGETDGYRRFSIMIGEAEAQSISLKINNQTATRPLTYDLIGNILLTVAATLEKVVIYDMVNDVFYSELHLQHNGEVVYLEARTSDAVALAVRNDAPIYIKSNILDIIGIEFVPEKEEGKENQTPKRRKFPENIEDISEKDLQILSSAELQQLLDSAVSEEKYELAVMIRNETNRRN